MSDWLGMSAAPRAPRPELRERVLSGALRPRRVARWPLAAAALLALAVAALLGRQAALSTQLSALQDTVRLLHATGPRATYVPVTIGAREGAVVIFADSVRHRLLVSCYNLAPNAAGEAYQLWFVTPSGYVSASLMPMSTSDPMTLVLDMPADASEVKGAAMSIEPRTGSRSVTGPVVFERAL